MSRDPKIDVAVEYVLAHPEEPIKQVALHFGVNRTSLFARLKRSRLFTAYDPRRKRANGTAKWAPIFEYVAANPTESIKSVAERFGVNAGSLSGTLYQKFGTSKRERLRATLDCRVCGEQDPAKFHRSTKYRSGYQDVCKLCKRNMYLASERPWGGKNRQRASDLGRARLGLRLARWQESPRYIEKGEAISLNRRKHA